VNLGTGLIRYTQALSAGDGLLLVPAGNTLTAFRLSNDKNEDDRAATRT
jgi:hypothetical protein